MYINLFVKKCINMLLKTQLKPMFTRESTASLATNYMSYNSNPDHCFQRCPSEQGKQGIIIGPTLCGHCED